MATKKTAKKTKKAAPKAAPVRYKSISECTPRECIRENKLLRMHVTIITVLSVAVCLLVIALVLFIKQ